MRDIRDILGADTSIAHGEQSGKGAGSMVVLGIIGVFVFGVLPVMNGTSLRKAWREARNP